MKQNYIKKNVIKEKQRLHLELSHFRVFDNDGY